MCLSRSDSEQQLFAKRQGLNGREQMVVEATPLQARMCGKEPAGSASLGREPNDDAQMEVLAGRFDGLVDWWTGGLVDWQSTITLAQLCSVWLLSGAPPGRH